MWFPFYFKVICNEKISKPQTSKNEDKCLQNRHAKRQKSPRTLNLCFCCPKIAVFNFWNSVPHGLSFLRVTSQMNLGCTFAICVNLAPDRKLKSKNERKLYFLWFLREYNMQSKLIPKWAKSGQNLKKLFSKRTLMKPKNNFCINYNFLI